MTGTLRDSLMALSEEVQVVDLHARVLRGSRRIKLRNRAIGAVAAFLALSSGAVAVAAMRPSPSPEPDPTMSPSPSPSRAVVLPNVDIRNAAFDVPSFPGDDRCPAANRSFTDGTAIIGRGEFGDIKLVMPGDPVRGDVDGEPGDEILTQLTCDDGYSSRGQVLAVKVAANGVLTSLGFVLLSPDHTHFSIVAGSLRVDDRTAIVEVTGPSRQDGPLRVLDLQTRGYAYRDGTFGQVSGPMKFATPPDDYRQVDFRNVTAMIRLPGVPNERSTGVVRISDGKGTVAIDKTSYEVTVLSSAFFTEAVGGVVLYRLTPAGGPALTFVNVYGLPFGVPGDWPGIIKDPPNLVGATKVETAGAQLRVTINGQVKTYRQDATEDWVSSA